MRNDQIDNDPVLNSTVEWKDADGNDRRRIVLDIPNEYWESFLENWGSWCNNRISNPD